MNLKDEYIHGGKNGVGLIRNIKSENGVISVERAQINTGSDSATIPWVIDGNKINIVNTFASKIGEITIRGGLTDNGSINLTMSGNQLQANAVGLKNFAFKESILSSDLPLASDTAKGAVIVGETLSSIDGYTPCPVKDGVIYYKNEVHTSDTNTGTVKSVKVAATSPLKSSTSTAQTETLNTTISLSDNYGDILNPYGSKTVHHFLAAPSDVDGIPLFRSIVASDIPALSASKITSGTFSADRIPNINLTSKVSGILSVANGGTGADALTGLLFGNGTSAITASTPEANSTTPKFLTVTTDANSIITPSWNTFNTLENTVGNVVFNLENNVLSGRIHGWKNYTTSTPNSTSSDDTIPTSKAVYNAMLNAVSTVDAIVYKGVITGDTLPAANKGDLYKINKAGSLSGVPVEAGDMVICNTNETPANTPINWDFIQANLDPTQYVTLLGKQAITGEKIFGSIETTSLKVTNTIDGNAATATAASGIQGIYSTTVPTESLDTGQIKYYYNIHYDATGNMPAVDNSNGILMLNRHPGDYYSFLGFSSDGRIYYKTGLSTNTTWNKVAYTSDIPTSLPANGGNADTVGGFDPLTFYRPWNQSRIYIWKKPVTTKLLKVATIQGYPNTYSGILVKGKFHYRETNDLHTYSTKEIPFQILFNQCNGKDSNPIIWTTAYGKSYNCLKVVKIANSKYEIQVPAYIGMWSFVWIEYQYYTQNNNTLTPESNDASGTENVLATWEIKDANIFPEDYSNYAITAGNADTLDGYHYNSFAWSSHSHSTLETYFKFVSSDVTEVAVNLASSTTAHTMTFYRNGISIPYQMDDSNDGGLLRVRGTTENNVIYEMATWDDSGAGETIQFNYYPTTSAATPTYSVSVPKKSGTIALTNDIPSSLPANGGNADTVDDYHASNLTKFYLSPMDVGATADSAKSWFINTMPSASGAIIYNQPGYEKTIIAGKSPSGAYGHMLQLNYNDTYLRILRYHNSIWESTDWEKISAGYADSAGNADTVDGYHASSLWRSDGGTWNPSANILLNASGNGQEWSFDISRNGYTGCYWHVWDSALSSMLKVKADDGKVYAPYNFVGNLEGKASFSGNSDTINWHYAGYQNNNIALFCPWPSDQAMKNAGFLTSAYGTSGYGHPDDIYLQAICKWAIATYSNQGDITLIGTIAPNSSGTCILHLYSNSGRDSSTLLPRYCSGTYTTLTGRIFNFGTVDYSWYYQAEALILDIPTITNYYWANIKISASSNTNTSPTFNTCYTSNWFRSSGSTGWYNESYGGGIYMVDSTYVRTYNNKAFYVSNSEQHAIYTAGGFASAKEHGSVLSTYYNGTWYGDTLYTHGNGNLSIDAPGGSLYISYNRGNTYFGGGSYYIDRNGYFNGSVNYASSAGSAPANGGKSDYVTINVNSSDENYHLLFGNASTVWRSSGVAVTVNPSTGNINAGNFFANSDIRYKTVIKHIDNASSILSTLPIFQYRWNNKEDLSMHIGSSAQDVMKIFPELVTYDIERDFYNLDYATLGTVAGISACKEIEKLKQKILELEFEIKQLKYGKA